MNKETGGPAFTQIELEAAFAAEVAAFTAWLQRNAESEGAMKVVLPKKKPEPVKPTWPFPTTPPVPERVHVPPKPSLDNFEDAPL